MLTQAELKRQLHYDPETGIFTRLISTARRVKVGDMAGNKNTQGYIQICINNNIYSSHRLAWLYCFGNIPTYHIDHINGITDDNRICNLREATHQQNQWNRGKSSNNTSGFKGVHLDSESKIERWIARATLNGKKHYLGRYYSKENAYKAYKKFINQHHGEFVRI
jgi:hypothetical protein